MIGRAAEAARIRSVVDNGEHTADFLVVLGDVGTGKTSLLNLAIEHGRTGRRTVIAIRGREGDHERPFAGLRRLLQPLLHRDQPQDALPAWDHTPSDPLAINLAASTVITAATRRSPVVLIVDDAHHFDQRSLEALSHVCRHARNDPLAVILAIQGEAASAGVDASLPVLLLEPLTVDAAAQLLDSQQNAPTGRSRREILRLATGNPLAIAHLCRTAASDQPARSEHAGSVFHDEVRSLPDATRALLVYAALSCGDASLSVIAAATGLPLRLADWSPAERAGLVTISDDAVAFRHPLIRVAALHDLSGEDRRTSHAALAEALWAEPVRRAWHLAKSAVGANEDMASALECAAEAAGRDGGYFEAACAFVRAAECSLESGTQMRRYVKALLTADRLGDPDWVEQLADVVRTKSVDADHLAIAARARSRVRSRVSPQRTAVEAVGEAIQELRTNALVRGVAAWFADESDICVGLLRGEFDRLRTRGNESEFLDYFTAMICALIDTCRWGEAHAMISHGLRAAKLARAGRLDVEITALQAMLMAYQGNGPVATTLLDRVWKTIDPDENATARAYLLQAAGIAAISSREWEEAYHRLRAMYGPDGSPLHSFLSPRAIGHLAIAAWRTGRRDDATRVLLAVRSAAGPLPTPRLTLLMHHSAALLGEEHDAEGHFRAALDHPEATRWPLARSLVVLHFSEWLRKQRRPVEARPLLVEAAESFAQLGAPHITHWAQNNLRAAGVAAAPPTSASWSALTPQQARMVRMAASGLRNREIAERLFLSPRTVASHLHTAYSKLGVTGRSGLRDVVDSGDLYTE